ncbi:MAG: hypothetical protein WBQ10_04825 [Terriglobales bacterium]
MGYTKIAGTPVIPGLYTMPIPHGAIRHVRPLKAPGGRRGFSDRREQDLIVLVFG